LDFSFTPRKARADGGLKKQTKLRDEIAKAMCDEMLVCSVDGFLEKLAPFSPDARWVDKAYDHLRNEKLLGTPAETTRATKAPTQRNTRASAQARLRADATPEAGAEGPEINAEVRAQR
jgi:hypothetical protein